MDLNQQKHEINQCQSEVEEADNGLTQHKQRPKGRKWKLKVRITKTREENSNGLVESKKIGGEIGYKSPEKKKTGMMSPIK